MYLLLSLFILQSVIRALTKLFPGATGKALTSEATSCFVKAITPPLNSLSLAGLRQTTPGALTAKVICRAWRLYCVTSTK